MVKNELTFNDYKRSVFGTVKSDIQQMIKFNTIRSYKHEVYTIEQSKIGLCSFDDKRYLIDNFNTYAYGHKSIKYNSKIIEELYNINMNDKIKNYFYDVSTGFVSSNKLY